MGTRGPTGNWWPFYSNPDDAGLLTLRLFAQTATASCCHLMKDCCFDADWLRGERVNHPAHHGHVWNQQSKPPTSAKKLCPTPRNGNKQALPRYASTTPGLPPPSSPNRTSISFRSCPQLATPGARACAQPQRGQVDRVAHPATHRDPTHASGRRSERPCQWLADDRVSSSSRGQALIPS